MSVKLDKQQTLLERLNEALLMVQSESLGRAADLGFTAEQIQAAKDTLRDFVSRLREKLKDNHDNEELSVLVARIREGQFELNEWLDELAQLETQLAQNAPLPSTAIPALESVLAILDEELTAAFNRLYSR
jgi:predicted  nucleic acid-binding Zn-ribbon protein